MVENIKSISTIGSSSSSTKIGYNHVKRRTFDQIRVLILKTLEQKRKTINQIAKDIDVNWRTVDNHLSFLSDKDLIKEVFTSEYVRIFDITDKGMQFLKGSPKQDIHTAEDLDLSNEVER